MKLAAIYTVWDDWDLLEHSIKNISPLVDYVIIAYSNISNFGELASTQKHWISFKSDEYVFDPDLSRPAAYNERAKRNYGLHLAREGGFTHFIMLDADEFYEPEPFLKEKERIFKNNIAGTVCRTKVYFKEPTLTIGYDTTLVPFIHKITPSLRFEFNPRYPYAFEGPKREIRIDPTRQLNINSGVEWSDITMHHYSWVRSDYEKKIRNSSARANIERSTILTDLRNAKAGYFCEFYGKQLEATSNPFAVCLSPYTTGLKP